MKRASVLLAVLLTSSCAGNATGSADGVFHWTISTAIEIDAPASRVWDVLVDLPAYREWNPFIVEARGNVAPGERLSLRMALPERRPIWIAPRLLVVDRGRELRWKGRLLVPGLFDGEHAFLLTTLNGGRTRLDHTERFSGALLPIARRLIYASTLQAFRDLDAALALRAASVAPARDRIPAAEAVSAQVEPRVLIEAGDAHRRRVPGRSAHADAQRATLRPRPAGNAVSAAGP